MKLGSDFNIQDLLMLVDKLEDMELSALVVSARKGQPETVVNIDDLKSAEKRIHNR